MNLILLYAVSIIRGSLRGGLSSLIFASNLNVHLYVLLGTAPFVIHILHWDTSRWYRIMAGISMILLLPLTIISQSRLFLIILALFVMGNILIDHNQLVRWKYVKKVSKLAIVSGPFIFFLMYDLSLSERVVEATTILLSSPGDSARGRIYITIADIVSEMRILVTGLGYGGFRLFIDGRYPELGMTPPHNIFIKSLIEMGVLGFFFILMSMLSSIRKTLSILTRETVENETRSRAASIAWALVILFVFMNFQPMLQPTIFYLLLALPYNLSSFTPAPDT